ncbi:MAG: hypothetical protein F2563_03070 [Actinobacteria bacterium]|uniref:Unannotated protein n=1 Tax=freshwater metagenome TaxID=449393 RepID=A0A6J6EUJ1_9ZZZZ|nr:hypothetical protein [Actinomycetota bacterium]
MSIPVINESTISAVFAGIFYRYAARDRDGSFLRSIIDTVITTTGAYTVSRFIDQTYRPCSSFNSGLILLLSSLGYAAYRAHIAGELDDDFEIFYSKIEIMDDDRDGYRDGCRDGCRHGCRHGCRDDTTDR